MSSSEALTCDVCSSKAGEAVCSCKARGGNEVRGSERGSLWQAGQQQHLQPRLQLGL
jgi:hypothetical protein